MLINDFTWLEDAKHFPKPSHPIVVFDNPMPVPTDGIFQAQVAGTFFTSDPSKDFVMRKFTFLVVVESWERDSDGDWREMLRGRLLAECLARWHE